MHLLYESARPNTHLKLAGWSGLAGLLVVALGALLWSPPDWLLDSLAALRPGCLYRARLPAPLIALTIDDGPDPVSTPLILAQLRRHEAHATFFLISSSVAGHEQLVRGLVAMGHELGNHGFSHAYDLVRWSAARWWTVTDAPWA